MLCFIAQRQLGANDPCTKWIPGEVCVVGVLRAARLWPNNHQRLFLFFLKTLD